MNIVLASASPRRKELLSKFLTINHIIPANINETPYPQEQAQRFVERMSREKAQQSALLYRQQEGDQPALILSGDTIVVLGNEILGKPSSEAHAFEILTQLSDQKHIVMSAFAISNQKGELLYSQVSESVVTFKALSSAQIKDYIATKEPLDKAGAYGIQGLGAHLVKNIEGSFYNIMGLDVIAVFDALVKINGISMTHTEMVRNYFQINEKIKNAWFKSAYRQDVQLIGVSKFQDIDKIKKMFALGLDAYGENYQQEWLNKYESLQPDYPTMKWHFIGQIQTNKAKKIGEFADFVHGVFKEEQASKLAQGAELKKRKLKIFIQLNLSGEESKGGIKAQELGEFLNQLKSYPQLEVVGLMTFPPEGGAQISRVYFKQLYQLLKDHQSPALPSFKELSMGVSDDFECAIEEGATFVRVGSALFGERKKANH